MKLAFTYHIFLRGITLPKALPYYCEQGFTFGITALDLSGGHLLGRGLWAGRMLGIVESCFLSAGIEAACVSMAHRFEYTDRLSQETQNTALQKERERAR